MDRDKELPDMDEFAEILSRDPGTALKKAEDPATRDVREMLDIMQKAVDSKGDNS